MLKGTIREQVIEEVMEQAEVSKTKARQVASYLQRLYFAGGGNIADDVLEDMYGSIFFDPIEEAEHLGLGTKSLGELLNIAKGYQSGIMVSNGNCPSLDSETLKIIKERIL